MNTYIQFLLNSGMPDYAGLSEDQVMAKVVEKCTDPKSLLSFYNRYLDFKEAIDAYLLTPEKPITEKLMPLAEKLIFEKVINDDEIAAQILLANGVSPLILNEDGVPLVYCCQTPKMHTLLDDQIIINLAIKDSLRDQSLSHTSQTEAANLSGSPKAASLSSNTEQEAATEHANAPLTVSDSKDTLFAGPRALPKEWYDSLTNGIVAQPRP